MRPDVPQLLPDQEHRAVQAVQVLLRAVLTVGLRHHLHPAVGPQHGGDEVANQVKVVQLDVAAPDVGAGAGTGGRRGGITI